MRKPLLVVIAGPTAVGKTAFSIDLAIRYNAPIISADSRQFYKEMNIGTAKPSSEELAAATHHFIDHLSIHSKYTVSDYEKEVLEYIQKLQQKHPVIILTGGSGLFIKAVLEGLDQIPPIDGAIRKALQEKVDRGQFSDMVKEVVSIDPEWAKSADLQNPRRVIRALEVWQGTGKKLSTWHNNPVKIDRPFDSVSFFLNRPREILYKRINTRMDLMIENGLFAEAKTLYDYKDLKPLKTVGYQEIYGYFDGEYDKAEAIRLLKRNSRRYARRQLTWFKKQKDFQELPMEQSSKIFEIVDKVETNL